MMPTKLFDKEELKEMVYDGSEVLERVETQIIDTTRWSIVKRLTFKDVESGLYYQTTFSEGATEQQDESPFEYDDDEVECSQVEQVEKVVKVWQDVK